MSFVGAYSVDKTIQTRQAPPLLHDKANRSIAQARAKFVEALLPTNF